MATVNAVGNYKASVPFKDAGSFFVLSRTVDLDAITHASGDTIQVIPVPSGVRCVGVECEIVTPSDAATSATMNIGDGADADGYDASVDLKATAGTITVTGSSDAYFFPGKRYTADDTIDITPTYNGATTTKGKIILRAFCIKM